MYYSHSYEDPNTGEVIDVMVTDPDGPEYRNARDHRGDHRGDGGGAGGGHPRSQPPRRPGQGGAPGGRVIVRHPMPRTQPQPQPHAQPVPTFPGGVVPMGGYIAIPKSALAEIIPTVGQVWASFLGLPEAPRAVGDDVIDRNNAAMHRDALATHAQNQTRILALTDLAARALRLML